MTDLEADLLIANAKIKKLEQKLAESQRRERAAVKIGDMLCEEVENCYGRETELTLKWRGPQEAGEEQSHGER